MFAKSTSVFALILAAVASTSYALRMGYVDDCAKHYQVRSGDTCNKIAQEQHVSSYQLASANRGLINPECSNLQPGEWICLGLVGQWCGPVYTVQYGDTCQEIANKFHISLHALYLHNPNINSECTNLGVGEVVCVAGAFNLVSQFGTDNRYRAGGCGAQMVV